jgi:hypothetical protein
LALPSFVVFFTQIAFGSPDRYFSLAQGATIIALNLVGLAAYAATRGIVLKRYWRIPS